MTAIVIVLGTLRGIGLSAGRSARRVRRGACLDPSIGAESPPNTEPSGECRPNETSSRPREKLKLRNAAEERRASPQIKQRRKARRRNRPKLSPLSERKDACNVVDVI